MTLSVSVPSISLRNQKLSYPGDSRSLNIKGSIMTFEVPKVMGILNVTPDSFFADSRAETVETIRNRVRLIREEGADIIDIGGYSTRPGAQSVTTEEEFRRVAGALEIIRNEWGDAIISVDTFRADVAKKCIDEWGVEIINDVGGGDLDRKMWEVVADRGVAYILMHMRGTPDTMGDMTQYEDVSAEVLSILAKRMAELRQMGVSDVIVDPGFGFAKDVKQNYTLLKALNLFHIDNAPVLAGLSRKTMIWKPLGITPAEAANGTTALNTIALMNGADILRVHDVKAAKETVKLFNIYRSAYST